MLFPLADFRFTSPSEYLLNNPPNQTSGLRASNTSGCPSFQVLETQGRGSYRLSLWLFLSLDPVLGYHIFLSSSFPNSTTPCTKTLLNSSPWVQILSGIVASRSPTRWSINIRSHIQKMSREIRPEPAIDRRNQLYFQSRYLLDAIEVRLQRFRREGTVPDEDLFCAQSDHDFLRQSIKVVWIMDYDRHQMATHGRLPIIWEESPSHEEEAPQDVMEEESQARQFERDARANLDDFLYSQMSA
ncbi:hypothetical protein DL766_006236 [Monosporascus sp. MC13-8B]|uniref:Uncharacterized protein n=1 Tax=Monosporascus cannonballus TaxID=155416 RepID=A0ABY0GT28_9PEZI|nr:hypothetical protein DL762_009790 [Monosporascus cannonballus]RYO91185.1 hypothetical protein DL763_005055 [Monosporascus cannonballus]RYP27736.1 hypothetical protein DL766_006236 [Monosporascus sp. MC13-8B]